MTLWTAAKIHLCRNHVLRKAAKEILIWGKTRFYKGDKDILTQSHEGTELTSDLGKTPVIPGLTCPRMLESGDPGSRFKMYPMTCALNRYFAPVPVSPCLRVTASHSATSIT